MAWRGWLVGILVVILIFYWAFKTRHIQRLKAEIGRVEAELSKGQEVWRHYPPLTAAEKAQLRQAQDRLMRSLPGDKDIPPLLQEISGLATEHKLTDLSFSTGDKAAAAGTGQGPSPAGAVSARPAPKPATPPAAGAQANPGPIVSTPLRVTFAGDYRDIVYFLEALSELPRLVTIQSIKIQRALPQQQGEVTLHAYYQKGEARP